MGFILALAQCAYPTEGSVADCAREWFEAASECHAGLIVFPEGFMGPYDEEKGRFAIDPEPLDGPFSRAIDTLASEYGMWAVYTLNERCEGYPLPYNTAIVTDSAGSKRGVYRKLHLFDAQGYRESDRFTPGSALLEPIRTPFCTLGIGICYDLRFPEFARAAALAGCELLLFPSAWVSGPGKKRQWETLLCARAIENGMFVAGVSRCDAGYVGSSRVFGPSGEAIAQGASTSWAEQLKGSSARSSGLADEAEALIIAKIELERIESVRATTPSLSHRRPDCYRVAGI